MRREAKAGSHLRKLIHNNPCMPRNLISKEACQEGIRTSSLGRFEEQALATDKGSR